MLAPIWRQDICNHHDDTGRSVSVSKAAQCIGVYKMLHGCHRHAVTDYIACFGKVWELHIDGSVQDSSALAIELLQSCAKPMILFSTNPISWYQKGSEMLISSSWRTHDAEKNSTSSALFYTSRPSGAHMHQKVDPSLAQIMVRSMVATNPFCEPMLA